MSTLWLNVDDSKLDAGVEDYLRMEEDEKIPDREDDDEDEENELDEDDFDNDEDDIDPEDENEE